MYNACTLTKKNYWKTTIGRVKEPIFEGLVTLTILAFYLFKNGTSK